ncbi:hypothetical protein F7725_013555 [Dissostichus mawsoni]|uniref:DUF4371 domain-containing protein n=1 Tax=Dissostichus mawsoni TaxID=36200 RepID=A0A7J5Y480_DISMA|nr:hypothetical protein F7725_013555 [Dissostichus mawsoni]
MSGRISGVQAKLKEQCPSALYVHCSNHALDLVLQEVAREVRVVADTLNFVRSVSVVVGESSKRKMLFQSMFGDDEANPCRLRDTEETEAILTDVGEQQWRREFYEALDLVTTELDRRFDQEGLQVAALREQTDINAANGEYSGMRDHCCTGARSVR